MPKKKPIQTTDEPELTLDAHVERVIRAFVVDAEDKVAAGTATPPMLQALVSLRRQVQRRDDGDVSDIDRRVRALEPAQRSQLLRDWNLLDSKRSGLA